MFTHALAGMMLALSITGAAAVRGAGQDYQNPSSSSPSKDFWRFSPGPLGSPGKGQAGEVPEAGFNYLFFEQQPNAGTCPCLDTFCMGLCDLLVRLFQSAGVAEARQSDALTQEQMQDMLDSADLLETDLESLCFGPDEPLDESVARRLPLEAFALGHSVTITLGRRSTNSGCWLA
jgi:hypothetical protein